MSENDDIEQIVASAKRNTDQPTQHIVAMLALICKAVRDLVPRNMN